MVSRRPLRIRCSPCGNIPHKSHDFIRASSVAAVAVLMPKCAEHIATYKDES